MFKDTERPPLVFDQQLEKEKHYCILCHNEIVFGAGVNESEEGYLCDFCFAVNNEQGSFSDEGF